MDLLVTLHVFESSHRQSLSLLLLGYPRICWTGWPLLDYSIMETWELSRNHDRQWFCPVPEQPATLPLGSWLHKGMSGIAQGWQMPLSLPFLLSLWERDEFRSCGMWGLPGVSGHRNDGTLRGEGNRPPTTKNQFDSMDDKFGQKVLSCNTGHPVGRSWKQYSVILTSGLLNQQTYHGSPRIRQGIRSPDPEFSFSFPPFPSYH